MYFEVYNLKENVLNKTVLQKLLQLGDTILDDLIIKKLVL